MRRRYPITLSLLTILIFASSAYSVDFLEGIYLYNRAQYDSLIYYVPSFIKEHPHEEGIARYFLAESYYNKALQTEDRTQAIRFLQRAREAFLRSRQSSDLKSRFREYYDFAGYKIGWCSFRLAELGTQPLENLQRAYQEFLDSGSEATDSLQVYAAFMAAESRLKYNSSGLFNLFDGQAGEGRSQEILDSYRTISDLYDRIFERISVSSSPHNLAAIKHLIRIKQEIVNYHIGDFYLKHVVDEQVDFTKERSPAKSARTYFEKLNYNAAAQTGDSLVSGFEPVSHYLNMMKFLQLYFIDRSDRRENQFLENWSQIRDRDLESELWFRRANIYHANPNIDGPEFNRLAVDAYTTASQIRESFYWLGYLQMILDEAEQSRENLLLFLDTLDDSSEIDVRQRILYEDAQYKVYLLDFESYYFASNQDRLRLLAAQLNHYAPQNPVVRDRTEQLKLLVSCALTSNTARIWSDALTGSDDQKLEKALATIEFILPRAALNIGTVRGRYINLLHRLFKLTETRRSDATRFFQGIVESLEAEIEPTPDAKIALFRKGAVTLDAIDSDFHAKVESDYIRARCLFFAEDFGSAEVLLTKLVNEQHHLRSLFYLAEIFRLTDRGEAARKCYEAIIETLQNTNTGFVGFWISNARAGLASADDTGGLDPLDALNYQMVQFQPAVDPGLVTYEHLAEERILRQQYADESIDWLVKFGVPQRAMYPSHNRLKPANQIYRLDFGDLGAVLDEVRHPVTSTLNVIVLTSDKNQTPLVVKLDEQSLDQSGGVYRFPNIELNSIHTVSVRHPDSYKFTRPYRFTVPGEDTLVIPLNEKLSYLRTGRTAQLSKDEDYAFPLRWDANFILNRMPDIDLNSQLVIDFENHAELRDYAYDPVGDRILAVNAAESSIWIYGIEPPVKRGVLQLDPHALNSPEGIAADSEGKIYISDWGNHRILVFDQSGALLDDIGSFGSNAPEGSGDTVKLTFPTRIAVVADNAGINFNGKTYDRGTCLYVADHYGIHICDLDGTYLDTIVPSQPEFSDGSFYGFRIVGYGDGSRLGLVSREKKVLGRVYEFVAR